MLWQILVSIPDQICCTKNSPCLSHNPLCYGKNYYQSWLLWELYDAICKRYWNTRGSPLLQSLLPERATLIWGRRSQRVPEDGIWLYERKWHERSTCKILYLDDPIRTTVATQEAIKILYFFIFLSYVYSHYLPLVSDQPSPRDGQVLLLCFPKIKNHNNLNLWWNKSSSPRIQGLRYHDGRVHALWYGSIRNTQWMTVFPALMCSIMDDTMCGSGRSRLLLYSVVCESGSWEVWMDRGSVRCLVATHPCPVHRTDEKRRQGQISQSDESDAHDEAAQYSRSRKGVLLKIVIIFYSISLCKLSLSPLSSILR